VGIKRGQNEDQESANTGSTTINENAIWLVLSKPLPREEGVENQPHRVVSVRATLAHDRLLTLSTFLEKELFLCSTFHRKSERSVFLLKKV